MYAPKYRLEAIETIGRKILLEYDRTLLEGPPQAIPVETIIETKFNLTLEYHKLCDRQPTVAVLLQQPVNFLSLTP